MTQAWPSISRRAHRVLLVPVGATEQHGPHLPLPTDTDIASALADCVARAIPEAVVVAPAVPYGSSGEHQGFPGSLSIGRDAIETMLVELGRSACRTWRRVLLISARGGNAEPVERAVATLVHEGRDVRAWVPDWNGDAHAGHVETSLMLAVAPERVDVAHAPRGNVRSLRELLPTMRRHGVAAVSPTRVLGDATTASAQTGRLLLDSAAHDLIETVRRWRP